MSVTRTSAISITFMGAACLLLSACKQPRDAPPTVEDLMQDRVALDGILLKCNDSTARDRSGADCEIARVAADRISAEKEAAEVAKRQQDFERNRDKLRLSDEQHKAVQAEQKKVDPYTMPLVPVDPAPVAASSANPH